MSGTLLVPYYEHPAVRPGEWAAILAAAPRLHGVVLNPASGPGTAPDPAFAEAAAGLRAAGVRVFGYIDTAYGRRPPAAVANELARHHAWYDTDGAFLDQAASGPDELPYYRALARAARSAGCTTLALNPGTRPHPAYARVADVLVTFEGPWTTYRTTNPTAGTLDTHECHLVHGVPPDADCAALARSLGAEFHCAVPGTGDHPWGTLPHTLEPVP